MSLMGHRSSIPVATALLAIVIESKVPSSFEAAALGILVAGVMVTVWEGASGSIRGGASAATVTHLTASPHQTCKEAHARRLARPVKPACTPRNTRG